MFAKEGLTCSNVTFSSQEELEHLNEASAEINKLELQLDVCKHAFLLLL